MQVKAGKNVRSRFSIIAIDLHALLTNHDMIKKSNSRREVVLCVLRRVLDARHEAVVGINLVGSHESGDGGTQTEHLLPPARLSCGEGEQVIDDATAHDGVARPGGEDGTDEGGGIDGIARLISEEILKKKNQYSNPFDLGMKGRRKGLTAAAVLSKKSRMPIPANILATM